MFDQDRVRPPIFVDEVHKETEVSVFLFVDPEVDAAVGKRAVAGGAVVSLQVELGDHAFVEFWQFVSEKNQLVLSKKCWANWGLRKNLMGSSQECQECQETMLWVCLYLTKSVSLRMVALGIILRKRSLKASVSASSKLKPASVKNWVSQRSRVSCFLSFGGYLGWQKIQAQ